MLYYSTSHNSPDVSLKDAILQGVAPDGGFYLPRTIKAIPKPIVGNLGIMSLHEIAYLVAYTLFGEDIDSVALKNIVNDSLNYEIPLRRVDNSIFSLELYHGPTMAFKDSGARFMARLLQYFSARSGVDRLNVLVATTGDSGSAVANSFLKLPGVNVHVLYPKGRLSRLSEAQFTTLGHNVNAYEVIGSIDDCVKLVSSAIADKDLNRRLNLTSANSINVGRLLPLVIHYFHAYGQLQRHNIDMSRVNFAVPCGNLSHITAGVIAKRMGLPIKRLICAQNSNNTFSRYINEGVYEPRKTVASAAPSMDKGCPTNFARLADLYGNSHDAMTADISAASYTDQQLMSTVTDTLLRCDYMLDPHTAAAFRAARELADPADHTVVLATAHPAKYKEKIERLTGLAMKFPPTLSAYLHGERHKSQLSPTLDCFKKYLLSQQQP